MAGPVDVRDALTRRVLRPALNRVSGAPSWLRWGAISLAALVAATGFAPSPAASHHVSAPKTFHASDWLGLSQPLFPALSVPAPAGGPATPAAPAASAPNVPIACAPTAAQPVATQTRGPLGGLVHAAAAADVITAPVASLAASAVDVVTEPADAILTDASSAAPTTTTTAAPDLLGGLVNGVVGALGGGTSTAAAGSNPLQSVLGVLSPTTTTTTTAPPKGASGASGTTTPSSSSQANAQNNAHGSPAPVTSAAPPSVPVPAAPMLPSNDIGCELIGSGSVGVPVAGETPAQVSAVATALSELGTPYAWGGESKSGFDCSGLVQYSYSRAGVSLPRVAQDQYDAGPLVSPGSVVVPGDLVFFGSGPRDVHHVGMFVGDGLMVDAPYTGAVVRLDRIAGFAPLVGVSDPAGHQIA
jgi:cell wall-associated NlpC family hydrolase